VNAGLPAMQAREICEDVISKLPSQEGAQFELVWKLSQQFGGPIVLALNRITDVFDRKQRNQNEV
jgi:Flp pilus assembly protein TadB